MIRVPGQSCRVRVRLPRMVLLLLTISISLGRCTAADKAVDPPLASSGPRLTLPAKFYAVVGDEMGVNLDNLILAENPAAFELQVISPVGQQTGSRWSITPPPDQVGVHDWQVRVVQGGQPVDQRAMQLQVVSASAGEGRTVRLLIVGDSLTHASITANDLAARLSRPGQPKTTFLGTHRPAGAAPDVAHEGYGGWTWERFVKHFEPNPDVATRKFSSPFVRKTGNQPTLDVAGYLHEQGDPPTHVIFFLGINDCFGAPPADPEKLDAHIDRVFGHADTLIAAFRAAAPDAELGICLTPPANARDSGFVANYQDRYTRWGWRRIQHRMVERQLEHFGQRSAERISVIPTELNIDTESGYPVDNAVHPNAAGYRQLAASMHAWLLARLSAQAQ